MLLRSIYLPAGQELHLTAAKAVATQLAANASPSELRILVQQGWIGEDHLTTVNPTDDELAGLADTLRAEAEQALHAHLDQLAASLHSRAVAHHRFGNEPNAIDAYTTGGMSWGDPPTDAYATWDVVLDDGAHPPTHLAAAARRRRRTAAPPRPRSDGRHRRLPRLGLSPPSD
jgi:hypothetical protein